MRSEFILSVRPQHPLRTIYKVTFEAVVKSPRISTDFPRIYTD